MKIQVTFEMDDDNEFADPGHPMGVTDEGFMALIDALSGFGDDIDVIQVD